METYTQDSYTYNRHPKRKVVLIVVGVLLVIGLGLLIVSFLASDTPEEQEVLVSEQEARMSALELMATPTEEDREKRANVFAGSVSESSNQERESREQAFSVTAQ